MDYTLTVIYADGTKDVHNCATTTDVTNWMQAVMLWLIGVEDEKYKGEITFQVTDNTRKVSHGSDSARNRPKVRQSKSR